MWKSVTKDQVHVPGLASGEAGGWGAVGIACALFGDCC